MRRIALVLVVSALAAVSGAVAPPAGADLRSEAREIARVTGLSARELAARPVSAPRGFDAYLTLGNCYDALVRAPDRADGVIGALFESTVHGTARPILPRLDRFRLRLGRVGLSDRRLRDGVLAWAQAIFVLRRFPRVRGGLCPAVRRWRRQGFAPGDAPLRPVGVRRVRLLQRELGRAVARIDRASRRLGRAGVRAPRAATFAFDGLLSEGGVELPEVTTRLSQCGYVAFRSRPRFVDRSFVPRGLPDAMAVLRRRQGPQDRMTRANLPSDARAVDRDSVRLLARRGGTRYFLFAGQAPAAPQRSAGCLRRVAPAQRRLAGRENARARRAATRTGLWVVTIFPADDEGEGNPAFGSCCVSSVRELRRQGGLDLAFTLGGRFGFRGLAPDGATRATLVVPGGPRLGVPVRDNFFVVTIPARFEDDFAEALLLQDARGRVVRRTGARDLLAAVLGGLELFLGEAGVETVEEEEG